MVEIKIFFLESQQIYLSCTVRKKKGQKQNVTATFASTNVFACIHSIVSCKRFLYRSLRYSVAPSQLARRNLDVLSLLVACVSALSGRNASFMCLFVLGIVPRKFSDVLWCVLYFILRMFEIYSLFSKISSHYY